MWINWRETKLQVRFKVAFGPNAGANAAACNRKTMPPNVMMQACPVAQLFEGVRLVQNGQTIENQTSYGTCAMANLYTKHAPEGVLSAVTVVVPGASVCVGVGTIPA